MAADTPAPLRFPGGGPTQTLLPDGTTIRTDKKGYVTAPDTITHALRTALLDAGYVEETPDGKGG